MAFKLDGDSDKEELAEINVVPLVDVMLVLLIIFMVTAPLSIGGVNVNLPLSRARSVSIEQERIVLSVDKSGGYFLDKTPIKAVDLDGKLKALFATRDKKTLYIRADKGVVYGKVVDVMTAAKMAGVEKISMLTQSGSAKK